MLRSEIFISEEKQLRVTHLILDYEPLSCIFQDVGQAIRAGDPRLARLDVSKSRFLARRDFPPVKLPIQHVPQKVAALMEETASIPLSLEAKIYQFHLEEEGEMPKRLVELSDSEADLDRFYVAHSLRLIPVLGSSNDKDVHHKRIKMMGTQKYLKESCYHRIECTVTIFLATFMLMRPLDSVVLATTTHKKLERVSDRTNTQVRLQMINKCRIKMGQKEIYNVRDPP